MESIDLIEEINHIADNGADEMTLKASLVSLNILECDLIQLGLVENLIDDIMSARLKIQAQLGWAIMH